jgi:hypothetical protein
MRQLTERDLVLKFMRSLGAAAKDETRAYFVGGVSAVLLRWREATIDVDVTFVPDRDELLKTLPALKDELSINIELASPAHFIPELPGWEERSVFIAREGPVSFYHYDFYSQALAKIERGHAQDRADVDSMIGAGLVQPGRLRELFDMIVPRLYRFPAVDPESFRRRLDEALTGRSG